jgi:signal transduction histidine kinase
MNRDRRDRRAVDRRLFSFIVPQSPLRDSAGRQLLLLLALFAVAVTVLGLFFFGRQKDQIRATARDELAAIVHLKVESIQRWRQERLGDGQWIFGASAFPARASDFFARSVDPAEGAGMVLWMDGWLRSQLHRRALLLDASLQVRLAVPAAEDTLDPITTAAVHEAWQSRKVTWADLHLDPETGRPTMDVVVPLVVRNGAETPVGVLVFEIDPQLFLFPHIQIWPTPSRSGETLLVRRDGDSITYLNTLRHEVDTALKRRVSVSERDVPAVRVVLGERGIIEGHDYRNEPVLAALGVISDSSWFIVAKRDLSEIDAPVREWAWLLGGAVLVLIGAGAAGIGFVWRTRESLFIRQELAERARADEVTRAREAELRALYAAMTEMLVVHEMVADASGQAVDYRILDCNPAFERSTGIPREQAVGALASALYGATPPPFFETYARVAATGAPARFEVFFPPLQKHFDISAFSPGPGRFATVTTDITARKNAEASLRQTQAILQGAMDQSTAGIAIADAPSGQLRYVNDAGLLIRGGNRQTIVDQVGLNEYVGSWQLLDFDGRLLKTEEVPLARAILFGETSSREFVIRRENNDDRAVMAKAAPIRDDAGKVVAAVVVFIDITERRQHDEERALLWHELTRKNEELEGMIYIASHDLRAPLVNMQGFSHRLEKACADLVAQMPAPAAAPHAADGPSAADQIEKALRYIRTSADKMDGLINGLLRVSRVGRISISAQTVDMERLVQGVKATLEIQVEQAGATVQIESLPPCRGDPLLLSQAFANLLDNALKYRATDRPLRVLVTGRSDGREAVYCIADTGLGIATEHQSKIWEMFHRLHPEGSVAGEGIGLKIVARILDRHHGRVWVESKAGEGSRFFVVLPVSATQGMLAKEAKG